MKKFAAILCAAAMALGMVSTAFANPSISDVTVEEQDAVVDEETAKIIPDGMKLVVKEADTDKYQEKNVAEVVTKLNDPKTQITMQEMLDILKVDTKEEIKTTSDTVIDPLEYEPISKYADLVLTDGTVVEYTIQGNIKSIKATIKMEALKDVKDIEKILLMQLDQKTGKVYFIEIDKDDYDPKTGEITVEFPCLGPFCILEKAE